MPSRTARDIHEGALTCGFSGIVAHASGKATLSRGSSSMLRTTEKQRARKSAGNYSRLRSLVAGCRPSNVIFQTGGLPHPRARGDPRPRLLPI